MQPLLALLPIVLFVVLLVGLRLTAASAGLASAGVCLTLAVTAFAYPFSATSLLGPVLEAGFTTATILWIILPALVIHEYQTRTDATGTLSAWLASVSPRPQVAALLIAWFFALFLEGAAGFGTPIALAAPLLVALGFSPEKAVVMALFGHAAGNSFGAVGIPIIPVLEAAPLDPYALSLLVVALHAALGWTLALLIFRMAGAEAGEYRAGIHWVPVAAASFFVPAALLAWFLGPELPTLGGALIGLCAFVLFAKARQQPDGKSEPVSAAALARAASPYLMVLAVVLITRMVPPVTEALRAVDLTWSFDRFGGSMAPLYHPGTMLIAGLLLATVFVGRSARATLIPALSGAMERLPRVALALLSVLLLARLMVHSGMIEVLASSAALVVGPFWPGISPLVGALGSFVTGSTTASNILFADLHVAVAEAGGFSPLHPAAGQVFGAAIGNIITPHNIIAGAATVGLIGREAALLRQTIPVCLAYAAAGGVLLLLISWAW